MKPQIISNIRTFPESVLLRKVWFKNSLKLQSLLPITGYCTRIHRRACGMQPRTPEATYTRFLRNRPQLEVLSGLARNWPRDQHLRIAVLACSTGAELYSALAAIQSVRPDLVTDALGMDISRSAVELARTGEYDSAARELDDLSGREKEQLFERFGNKLRIRAELAREITWHVDSILNPRLAQITGPRDIVMVNNCLVHFSREDTARAFSHIVDIIVPGGYLFAWGMDLDARTEESTLRGLIPVSQNIENIHNADDTGRRIYPWKYWGLEPLDKTRTDWTRRYATVFRKPLSQDKDAVTPRNQT